MENKQPRTFEEIDAQLQNDLLKITNEIAEIRVHIKLGQDLLKKEIENKADQAVVAKYQKDIEQLEKGLKMFEQIKNEIQQTIQQLHETVKKAEEHIK